jgi:fatty acid desaturase
VVLGTVMTSLRPAQAEPRTTVVPSADSLPDVLPTERLTETGVPTPEVRAELRRIASYRNVGSVLLTWAQAIGTVWLAIWIDHPVAYVAAFLLMGPAHARFVSLGHEAAHRLLFTNKRANDFVGRWLVGYPSFFPFDLYRRVHFAHHKDEFGPNEPDLKLYNGYPITRRSFWRKMRRDAFGSTGWKNLKPLLRGIRISAARPTVLGILAMQVPLIVASVLVGRWWLWPVFWLAPWMTVWRVINRLRAIAEHGGMTRSKDRRLTTHHVRQGRLARFFMVPFNIGWHLAHHVDIGVPWRNLPALQRELEAAGWVTEAISWPSYPTLWRALRARPTAG